MLVDLLDWGVPFEQIEAIIGGKITNPWCWFTITEALEAAGVNVQLFIIPNLDHGGIVWSETAPKEIEDIDHYHAMAIVPASKKNAHPYGDLLVSSELTALIQRANEYGLGIYATCGGVRVLAAAGFPKDFAKKRLFGKFRDR